jgi:hypothetical protein
VEMEFPSIAADGSGTAGAGIVAIAAGAWAVAAPLLFGADEASDWGWHATAFAAGPGIAAAAGGLAMVRVRRGAWLALLGGLLLIADALLGPLWAGGRFGTTDALADAVRLLVWIGFFVVAGALAAGAGAYALGLLDTPPWERVGRRPHSRCETRRRRASATLGRPHVSARRPHTGG